MTSIQVMALPRAGEISALAIRTVDAPAPRAGQITVRVAAAALNPADLKVARGDFVGRLLHAREAPLVVGYDYAGTVDACGPGVDDLRPGDAVFGFLPYARKTRGGTFSERVVVDAATAARLPAHVPPELAAAAATPGLTALQALRDRGRLRAGGRVLIVGASGGVGSIAVGVAKRLGAHVTGLCSAHAVDFVRSLGADEVVDRGRRPARDLDATFDVILDTAAAYGFASLRRRLAPRGSYVTTLPSAGLVGGGLLALFSSKRCKFIGVAPVRADLEQLATWLAEGLTVPIDSSYPVRELAVALERLGRGTMRGRIAIDVAGGF
jgi:NADPH:quinone reductase-like Zn-dependent oxidoreductase